MLTLADASMYFDRVSVMDPASGRLLFYGQIDNFDDSKRDSATAYRRILSVRPGTPMPGGRVVIIHGKYWIIGDSEIDGMEDQHRQKYVLHPARKTFNVSTLSGYLAGTVATTTWADVNWVKDAKEEAVSSRAVPLYAVYLPQGAGVSEYSVLWDNVNGYLSQPLHNSSSGIDEVTCLKLDYAPVTAVLTTRTFDPVAGAYSSGIDSNVKCLRVRWQSLYLYGSQADIKYQEGDDSFVLPTGTVISTKDTLTVSGKTWKVLSVETLGGAVVVHGRPA